MLIYNKFVDLFVYLIIVMCVCWGKLSILFWTVAAAVGKSGNTRGVDGGDSKNVRYLGCVSGTSSFIAVTLHLALPRPPNALSSRINRTPLNTQYLLLENN